MSKLNEIFKKLDFSEEKQIAIIQILVEGGCFQEVPLEGNIQHLDAVKKVSIPKKWAEFKKELSSDSTDIQEILNHDFKGVSDQELFNYLKGITQLKLLGKQDTIYKTHYNIKTNEFKMISEWQDNCVKSLGLLDTNEWPEIKGKLTHAFIHSNTNIKTKDNQGILDARMDMLFKNIKQHGSETVTLYYPTSPRGLFNNESYVAEILTEWFIQFNEIAKENEKLIFNTIQDILTSSKYDWKNNLDLLKKEILEKVRLVLKNKTIQWPLCPEFPPEYDKEVALEKKYNKLERNSLSDSWPTTEHMLPKLIEEYSKKYELKNKFILVVMPILGKVINDKYQIADTQQHLNTFKDFFKKLDIPLKTLAIVSDNSHTSGAQRQFAMTQHAFPEIDCIAINNSSGQLINFGFIKQEFAKYIYTLHAIVTMAEKSNLIHKSIFAPLSEIKPEVQKELATCGAILT